MTIERFCQKQIFTFMIIIQQTTQLKLPIMEEQLCDMSTDRGKVMLSELCFVTLKQIAI